MKAWVLRLSIKHSLTSTYSRWSHSCILLAHGAVQAKGVNRRTTFAGKDSPMSIHAEDAACRKLKPDSKLTYEAYLARTSRGKYIRNSRPCQKCQLVLKAHNVRRAYYTISKDEWGVIDL